MIKAGVPTVPGSEGPLPEDAKEIVRVARKSAIRDHQGSAAAAAGGCASFIRGGAAHP